MNERYPIGETASLAVSLLRHEREEAGYPQWSAAIALRGAEATISVPGHYTQVLAARLQGAETRFAAGIGLGARLGRDEYLDLTAIVRGRAESLALSSTSRSPLRVSLELPRAEIEPLALLLTEAHELIETLRQGLALVPDSLPDPI